MVDLTPYSNMHHMFHFVMGIHYIVGVNRHI